MQAQSVLLDVVRLEVVAGQPLEALVGRAVGVRATRRVYGACDNRAVLGTWRAMAEPPPPRDPRDPADDETVVVPPSERTRSTRRSCATNGGPRPWSPATSSQSRWSRGVVVEETEEARRKPPLIWPWLLALLLLVLAGPRGVSLFSQQDESTVPGVTGLPQERAEAEVREAGLEPETTRQESTRPQGIVIEQSPEAGRRSTRAERRLVVSTGPPRDTVPNSSARPRRRRSSTAGPASSPRRRAFSQKKEGIVVSQEPKAGSN